MCNSMWPSTQEATSEMFQLLEDLRKVIYCTVVHDYTPPTKNKKKSQRVIT